MGTGELFEGLSVPARPEPPPVETPEVRVLRPNRQQLQLRPSDLESLLPEEHTARLVWAYVDRQDLSALYAPIKAVAGGCGRSAIAPEILLSLWLYATLEGVGSARARWRGCARRMTPTAGCVVACGSITTRCRTSGWDTRPFWTAC
jgi:hypothetical protein